MGKVSIAKHVEHQLYINVESRMLGLYGRFHIMEYGYVRVSSKNQNVARQMAAMYEVGIDDKHIFVDKFSGKDFKRPYYKRMLKKLKAGDLLYIKSIDRLGRNYEEIIEQWRFLAKVKDIDIKVIDFPLLDTKSPVNGITGKFIADLVLQILSYVAQVERENIKQRQAEGIKEAKAKGVQFGRPKLAIPEEFPDILQLWLNEKISLREASRRLNTNHNTFSRWAKAYLYKNNSNNTI